jgi:hypothetical protein
LAAKQARTQPTGIRVHPAIGRTVTKTSPKDAMLGCLGILVIAMLVALFMTWLGSGRECIYNAILNDYVCYDKK